jgi:FtsP/CotA-like multicopper oxidase with cupredoxin domain
MMNRRQFLTLAGTGAAALLGNGLVPPLYKAFAGQDNGKGISKDPDLIIGLRAAPSQASIFSGPRTNVWKYTAEVLKGDSSSVVNVDQDSYLGPVLRVNQGQKIRIVFQNALPARSIIHWHGLHVPADMDGHPRFVVPPGGQYIYEFEVQDRAGTYWYHPHPHGRTGFQVYGGLAGLLLVNDQTEKKLNLPNGEYEVPLVIQDREFDGDNQLVYLASGMMSQMTGMMGEAILVNGRADFQMDVSTRVYRLRFLNGSNARAYKLAWSDGTPLIILGTDGGLLTEPLQRESVLLGPGERLDIWADFSKHPLGTRLNLVSHAFETGFSGMMRGGRLGRGMMGDNRRTPHGAPLDIMQVHVVKREVENRMLPHKLAEEKSVPLEAILNPDTPRRFELSMFHMHGLINNRSFHMTEVAEDEIVAAGSNEIWEFNNSMQGMEMMGMPIPHPMHLHGAQFKVLERAGNYLDGYLDEGWKDTVLLMPGETVRILVRFGMHKGLYLYHCHNLEHGDGGMMRNYLIKPNTLHETEPVIT